MFTVCPKCTLTLAVTAGDLRVGQGYVRCGRCSNVFNALLQLTEEPIELHASPAASPPARAPPPLATVGAAAAPPAAAAAAPRRPATPAPAAAPAPPTPSPAPAPAAPSGPAVPAASSIAARPSAPRMPPPATTSPAAATPRALGSGAARVPASPKTPEDATDEFHIDDIDLLETTGTFESILLEGDAITRTEGVISEPATPASPPPARRAIGAAARAFVARSKAPAAPARAAAVVAAQSAAAGAPPIEDETPAEEALSDEAAQAKAIAAVLQPGPQRGGWLLMGVSALLAGLLIVQMVNHWRNTLASSPFWSTPLTRIYGALGVSLSPHWDLAAYDVRQQGAQSDPADPRVIRVRLSVSNHAARAQPVPLLRLTLLDRYGKHIAARDLTPAEYWPRGRPLDRFLGSDQRIDSEVAVRTATSDSSSFEIDVCLRDAAGGVRCASDNNGVAAAEGARASSGA